MSESLNIIRTGSEPTNQGSIGFDLGDVRIINGTLVVK